MRSTLVLGFTALCAMLLQTTVFPSLPWLPVVPDLILILAVYLGIRHRGVIGACGAFLLGYFLDTFSGTLPGLHAFALSGVYAAVQLVARLLWVQRGLPVMAVAFLGACVQELGTATLAGMVAAETPVWQHVLRYGFLEASVAALVAPMVFAWVTWEKRLLGLT